MGGRKGGGKGVGEEEREDQTGLERRLGGRAPMSVSGSAPSCFLHGTHNHSSSVPRDLKLSSDLHRHQGTHMV